MAESGKITREDIIAKDAFTSAVDEAKQLLDVINQISNALKTKAKSTADGFAIASPQSIEDVKKLTDQIAELKKQIAALEAVTEKQKKAQKELTAAQAEENLARQKQRQEVMQQVKITSELTTEYEKQVVRLSQVKKELKDLSVQGKEAPKALVEEFNKLDKSVTKAEQGVKEFQRAIGNYSSATAELKDLTRQLLELEKAGKRNTDEFKNLRARAAELKDTISDVKAEVKALASDTRTIDGLVGSVNLLANAYQVAEGAAALLGEDSKEWQETMVKLQAIMAVTTGLQEIQNLLQKESAAMMFLNTVQTKAAAAAQSLYAFATGGATTATKAFRIALLATGIGAIVVLIGSLAGAFDSLGSATEDETDKQLKLNEALKEHNELVSKAVELGQARAQGARNSTGELQREFDRMKARGASEKELYEQGQKIRRQELNDLETQRKIKASSLGIDYTTSKEFYDLSEKIRNKANEIEVARLEFIRVEKPKAIKKAANEEKATVTDLAQHNIEEYEKVKKAILDAIDEQREAQDAMARHNQEAYDKEVKKIKDREREKIEAERRVQQQVLQGVEQGVERRSEIVQNGLEKELKKQDEAIEKQQELASKGLENTLAYQEKKRAELQAKLEREKEAERKREEALQLAGAFLGSYNTRLDKGQQSTQALAGALADTLIAKAISSTIAGAFAEGVENFQGKGTGTSDSNLIAFSHGESVVTAKATQQYSGLVTAMNKGLVDDYVKQMILPDMDAPMSVNAGSFQSAAIVYTLTKELGELKQAIKNKQEIKVNWNAQGERVEEIVKDGMKTVIKHVTTGKRRL
jgi:myosin heavy subunit